MVAELKQVRLFISVGVLIRIALTVVSLSPHTLVITVVSGGNAVTVVNRKVRIILPI